MLNYEIFMTRPTNYADLAVCYKIRDKQEVTGQLKHHVILVELM